MKMKTWKIICLLGGAALGGLALYMLLISPADSGNRIIRLAVPAGAPEVPCNYMAEHFQAPVSVVYLLETQSFQDCCSNQAQMALAAGEVDMAVLCSDSAHTLVSQDDRYQEIGAWISGSDVLAVSSDRPAKRIAYAAGRGYQEEMAQGCLENGGELLPMMLSAIPYALETGVADAGILDVTRASRLPEGYSLHALPGQPGNCYILVARKELLNTAAFQSFRQAWRQSALDLQDSSCLESAIAQSFPEDSGRKEGELWNQLNIRIPVPN